MTGTFQTASDRVRPSLSDDWLRACLLHALAVQDVTIVRRKRLHSFQHHLEIVRVSVPATEGRPRKSELFVRVYRGQLCWCDVARRNLPEREWAAWRIAQRATLPLPHTCWQGWFDGAAVAVQRRLPGRTLWRLRNASLIRQSGELLARLHRAQVNDDDRAHLACMRLWPLLDRLAECAAESRDDLSLGAVRTLRVRAADVDERPAVFLHGDFHACNVLCDGRQITALIDWEDSSWGDPRLELATMDMFLRRRRPLDWLQRGRADRLADLFLQAYREAAGWDPGSLEYWKCLLDAGSVVIGKWLRYRVERGLDHPASVPEVWYRIGREAQDRVRCWAVAP